MSAIKLSVIGAGSVVFSLGLVKSICLTAGLRGSTVHFMDINEERLDVICLAQRYAEDLGSDLKFAHTQNRAEALQDANFVVNTATATHNEYFMKRRREMVDAMGYFSATPACPNIITCRLCWMWPKTWKRFAQTPGFCRRATRLRRHHPDGPRNQRKVCGLCHGHYGVNHVARVIGLDPEKITWQAPGLNHNIWLTHLFTKGKMPCPCWTAGLRITSNSIGPNTKTAAFRRSGLRRPFYSTKYRALPHRRHPRRGGW